ncbi:MAG TPA: tetratricopeptide repeat protein, partial [Clostridia bacterium]|nr:tetratricopeptide repeat protein [Clostridia bacterium]
MPSLTLCYNNPSNQPFGHFYVSAQNIPDPYRISLYNDKRTEDAIAYYNRFLNTRGAPLSDYLAASMNLSQCCLDKGDMKEALRALFRSFEHDAPKTVICCWLGYYFKSIGDFTKAISWFKLAINLKKPETIWGTAEKAYCGYIPSLETAVCYYKQGDLNGAVKYNNKALDYMPGDPTALRNKEMFSNAVKVYSF